MLFQYDIEDGTSYVNWCNGEITSIISAKLQYVRIQWSQDCLGPDDPLSTKEKLLPSKWNPNKASKGVWREYFGSL